MEGRRGYVRERDSREDYENRFETNGIIGASRSFVDIPRKRDSTADYRDEGTRLQRGTRRLARIPEQGGVGRG